MSKSKSKTMNMMSRLEFAKIELDNHIGGLEISKSTGFWNEEDERALNLMKLLRDILHSIREVEE